MAARIVYTDVAPAASADAAYDAYGETSFSTLALSTPSDPRRYLTLEQNAWILGAASSFLGANHVTFWSEDISDAGGEFATAPAIDIRFDNNHSSMGVSIIGDALTGDYCDRVHISWYRDATQLASEDFEPDAVNYFCANAVTAFNHIVISLNRTAHPLRRARLTQISYGVIREFHGDEIRSASLINETDLLSAELPASQLNWVLESHEAVNFMFQFKQPIAVFNGQDLLGTYYVEKSRRQSATIYQVTAIDAIGVLGQQNYAGDEFIDGLGAKSIIELIVDGAFPITYDGVIDQTLYGVIPAMTKRAALQQVLFACGWCCRTDGGTDIKIFAAPTVPAEIGTDRTYVGVSIETAAIVTQVNVTAHSFSPDQYGDFEIGGVRYGDSKTVYTAYNPEAGAADIANVINVDSAYLISADNGAETAQRVLDYYTRRNRHRSKIILDGEQLGDCVTQPTPWGTTETGNICAMTITLSGIVAADVESVGVEDE